MSNFRAEKYEYNLLDCKLETGLHLRTYGYEDFTDRESMSYFHRKTDHTFQFVLKGEGTYNLDCNKYSIKPHDLFYLPPDVPLQYSNSKTNPYFYYWFALNGEKVDEIIKMLPVSISNPVIQLENPDPFFAVFEDMFSFPRSLFKLKSCIYMILHLLCGHEGILSFNNTSKSLIRSVIEFIELNYPQLDFQIESLTTHFHISQAQLYRLFTKETGVSPKAFLTNYRMEKARELLERGEKVTQAAHSTGYEDIYHFSKQFKKYFEIAPSAVKTLSPLPLEKSETKK